MFHKLSDDPVLVGDLPKELPPEGSPQGQHRHCRGQENQSRGGRYRVGDWLLRGRIDEAIAFIQRALQDPRYSKPALAYTNMGLAYFKKGAPPQAIEQFRIALEYQSNLPEAHYNLGLVYAHTGELDKAIRAFREAVRYRPSYVEAHASLGAVLLETGRQEEARAAFERVIALAPDSDMATASRKQLQHLTP